MTETSSALQTPADAGGKLARQTVILASGSATRAAMLRAAGVACDIQRPRVDEEEIKLAMRADGADAAAIAEALAESKARYGARHHPGQLVIGADQVLECDGEPFDKPVDRDDARRQLRALSGKTHRQVSCACIVLNDERIWHHVGIARLTMRPLKDDFIDAYLDAAAGDALAGPGAYAVERLGAQLFSRIDGDWFTILGLPLLPLLDFLRLRGALMA